MLRALVLRQWESDRGPNQKPENTHQFSTAFTLLHGATKEPNQKQDRKKKLNVAIFNQDQGYVLHSHFILTNYKSSYYSIKTINYLTKFCNDSVVVKVDLKSNKRVNSKRNSKFHLEKLCI